MHNLKKYSPVLVMGLFIALLFYAVYDAASGDMYAISNSTGKCVYVDTQHGVKACPDEMPERYSMFWVE